MKQISSQNKLKKKNYDKKTTLKHGGGSAGLVKDPPFSFFFCLPICLKPYKSDYRQKNILEILRNNKENTKKIVLAVLLVRTRYAIKKWSLHRELMTKIADTTISL